MFRKSIQFLNNNPNSIACNFIYLNCPFLINKMLKKNKHSLHIIVTLFATLPNFHKRFWTYNIHQSIANFLYRIFTRQIAAIISDISIVINSEFHFANLTIFFKIFFCLWHCNCKFFFVTISDYWQLLSLENFKLLDVTYCEKCAIILIGKFDKM